MFQSKLLRLEPDHREEPDDREKPNYRQDLDRRQEPVWASPSTVDRAYLGDPLQHTELKVCLHHYEEGLLRRNKRQSPNEGVPLDFAIWADDGEHYPLL